MIYLDLLIGFLKVGLFSFGGAYGAIPLIRDVVLDYGWMDEDAVMDMIAVSESTPGPIMVNLATYVGSKQAGFPGAVLATAAVVLPAFIIILLIMVLLKRLLQNRYFQAVLSGLKPCIMGIILATGCYMIIKNCAYPIVEKRDMIPLMFTAVLAVIFYGSEKVLKKKITPIMLIIVSALIGVAVYGI